MSRQKTRRIWVAIYYLVLFGLYPFVQGIGVGWETLVFLGLLFVSPALAQGTEMLKAYNDPEINADERQRAFINEMMVTTYVVLAAILLVPAFMLGFTDDLPIRLGEPLHKYITGHLLTFHTLTLLIGTLPPAVMMWLEPDPLPDDGDTVANHQTAH